jgi:hypothetical protein
VFVSPTEYHLTTPDIVKSLRPISRPPSLSDELSGRPRRFEMSPGLPLLSGKSPRPYPVGRLSARFIRQRRSPGGRADRAGPWLRVARTGQIVIRGL